MAITKATAGETMPATTGTGAAGATGPAGRPASGSAVEPGMGGARTGGRGSGRGHGGAATGELAVLIVEDDAFIAMDVEFNVEEAGHRVVATAVTASDAVAAAEAHRPDVVLMDLRLADGSNGSDAAREILDRFGIRSIFMSGNLDPATREELAPLEPIAMISKPFLPVDLMGALAVAAERAN